MNIIDELTLLGDEHVDYGTLSDDTLVDLALGDDLFIATSALSELTTRNSSKTNCVAQEILSNSIGDRYLQAAALESLFKISPEQAIVYITRYLGTTDRYIADSVSQLILENPSYFNSLPLKVADITNYVVAPAASQNGHLQKKKKKKSDVSRREAFETVP